MKPAWHGPGLFCLVSAGCLVACIGCSAPSNYAAETTETIAQTPAMIFFTPECELSDCVEEPQAPATDLETAVTANPSPGIGTPVMIFFTPTADQTDLPELQVGTGTPVIAPESGDGTLAPQFTRVALQLTPSSAMMPKPPPAASGGTAESRAGLASDEGPTARWPKGWGWGVAVVLGLIVAAWLLAGRRSKARPPSSG